MTYKDIFWHKFFRRPYVLTVKDQGIGDPIVMLHGLGLHSGMWDALVKLLQSGKQWRIIRPDLLGFGDSPKPQWGDYTVGDHARAVVATLKKLGIRQPVTIVGHSMGCLIAAHIATKYPRKVKRLILYAPPLFANEPAFPKHLRKHDRYFAFYEYLVAHPNLVLLPKHRLWRMAKKTFGLYLDQEKWLPFERSLRNTIMAQQAYNEFIRLSTPTDIIHGRLDFVIVRAEVKSMLRANPQITMHTFTGTHTLKPRGAKFLYDILNAHHG
jgi:pimeloyl-ACP methyl ester carboxylesterase